MRAVVCVLCLALLTTVGCSLQGLDRIPIRPCTSDADCQPLNIRFSIGHNECARFQCNEETTLCERREHRDDDEDHDPSIACGGMDCDDGDPHRSTNPILGVETCDGIDNDCDLVIDESVLRAAPVALATGFGDGERVSYGSRSGTSFALGARADLTAPFSELGDPSAGARAALSTPFQLDQVNTLVSWYQITGLDDGCPGASDCHFDDVAAAGAGDETLIAVVSSGGCAAGSVRIGYAAALASPSLILRGPTVRSNVFAGFDRDASRCNGAMRIGGAPGAARPAVAAIDDPTTPQGLVAWVGDSLTRSRCGGIDAPVEAVVVWLEHGMGVGWVTASNDAVPVALGTTNGGGPPALLALPDASGFVAAFGTSSGIELRFVPRAANPRIVTTSDTPSAARATPAMAVGAHHVVPAAAGGSPDHIALAIGHSAAGSSAIGMTWIEHCGGADEQVWFSTVTWSTGASNFTASAPEPLSTGRVQGNPALRFTDTAFVVDGFARGGATSTAARSSGWLVVWPELRSAGPVIVGQRVLELDSAALDDAPFDVTTTSALGRSVALLPPTTATSTALLALSVGGDALLGGSICGVVP